MAALTAGGRDRKLIEDQIADYLADIPRQRSALLYAMGAFGEDFDLDPWRESFDSGDPALAAQVSAVNFPFVTLHNDVNALVRLGLELAEPRPIREDSAPAAYRAFSKAGAIAPERVKRLGRINRVRNRLTHVYARARAEDVHAAAVLLLAELPGFLRDYARWLKRHGISLGA